MPFALDLSPAELRALMLAAMARLDERTHLDALRAIDRGDVDVELDLTTGAVNAVFTGAADLTMPLTLGREWETTFLRRASGSSAPGAREIPDPTW